LHVGNANEAEKNDKLPVISIAERLAEH